MLRLQIDIGVTEIQKQLKIAFQCEDSKRTVHTLIVYTSNRSVLLLTMETKGLNISFQEDEDYLDDPISLLDFEENIVFSGSEHYLKNITIEDPGYLVNISEDYELGLQKSISKFKELKKPKKSSGYANNNVYFLRNCSIKVVDCDKFPWYYRNKLESTNKTQYPNIEKNVVEIEEKDEEITVIDLTEIDYEECNDDRIQEEYTNNIEKVKAHCTEFTNVDNSVDGKVGNQTFIRFSKPVLNMKYESHTKVPRSEVDEATDLIISTYTRLTDKTIQKLKTTIEFCENSKNISHNLGKNLLLGSKNFTETRDNLLTNTKNGQKFEKISTDNINNDGKNVHSLKNSKKSNKLKNVYTSEQISKTKMKIMKSSLKSKDISSKNSNKEKEGKGGNLILKATNREQYESFNKKNNSNEKQQNREQNCNQKKQERIQNNSYSNLSLSSPVLTKILTETKKSTSLPNQNIASDIFHGCNKQLYSADRIIPHFHDNAFLNHSDISKSKSNTKCPKPSKDTTHINNNETKNNNILDSKALNMGHKVTRIHDCCIVNNNRIVNNNEHHKRIYNNNVDISNISAIHSVNSYQVTSKLPDNNRILLKRSTHASNVVKENVNNTDLIKQSKKNPSQEEERLRYLLPSNLPDSRNQNIFSYCNGSNLIFLPYI